MTANRADTLGMTIAFGGDIGPVRKPVERLAETVRPHLERADFRFGQCERTYSHRGTFPRWTTIPSGEWSRLPPEYAAVFDAAGINIASVASNHALDWGVDPLLDTIALLREKGIEVVGGGADEAEARRPVIVEKNGVRVAILAYCSVIRDGWAATGDHPGVAGIRVRTWYDAVDFQPGCPPVVRSEAREDDVAAAAEDIRRAREQADAVVVSMHWGIRYIPKVLAEYQQPLAHHLMDAGADLIVGHHAHLPKAVESYRGSTCLYSIGNFLTTGTLHHADTPRPEWNLYWHEPDPDSLYAFSRECRQMVIPEVRFSRSGVERVALRLGYINDLAQPEVVSPEDARFAEISDYLEWVSNYVPHTFTRDGDVLVVGPGQ